MLAFALFFSVELFGFNCCSPCAVFVGSCFANGQTSVRVCCSVSAEEIPYDPCVRSDTACEKYVEVVCLRTFSYDNDG